MGLDMGKMLKQIQRMQSDMAKMQAELGEKTVEASAGGGMVTATFNGNLELQDIKITRDVIDPDDPEMLQDLVLACVNDGLRQAREMVNKEMSRITGGLNIPGLV